MADAEAPLFHDVAEAPAGGRAVWLRTDDGVRIRVGLWPAGAKGTVLLFPGRTEYVEKYGPAAGEFAQRGYGMLAVDWRGQGLADRLLPDPAPGHVVRFGDYQRDVAAVMALARAEGLPGPFHLVSHSMGAAIGLRALHDGLPVRAAVFSAPMWGIRMHPALRPLAWGLATLLPLVGMGSRLAPSTDSASYVATAAFAGNVLTRDPDMWAFMQRQLAAHPELAIGGPTVQWLREALCETRALARLAAPATPALTMLGAAERVVDIPAIRALMARWPGGRLDLVADAEHELMMEGPAIRARFYDAAAALFDANR